MGEVRNQASKTFTRNMLLKQNCILWILLVLCFLLFSASIIAFVKTVFIPSLFSATLFAVVFLLLTDKITATNIMIDETAPHKPA
jgi:hypothetical protein